MSESRVILGIDPGTTLIGFGVIKQQGNSLQNIEYGCLKIDTTRTLQSINEEMNKTIKKYKPALAIVEKLFFFKNAKTITNVSEARGVILLSLMNNNVPLLECTPLQVKQGVTGYGKADKKQMQRMVKLILNLESEPKPDDAADALALAIYGSTLNLELEG